MSYSSLCYPVNMTHITNTYLTYERIRQTMTPKSMSFGPQIFGNNTEVLHHMQKPRHNNVLILISSIFTWAPT